MQRKVLFLCTGNYYRSRFAEMLFNHLAACSGLPWRADSRGLAVELGSANIGPISPLVIDALGRRGVYPDEVVRPPAQLEEADLLAADLVVALNEDEHRFWLARRHPRWEGRVRYWRIADLDDLPAELALAAIDGEVRRMIEALGTTRTTPSGEFEAPTG